MRSPRGSKATAVTVARCSVSPVNNTRFSSRPTQRSAPERPATTNRDSLGSSAMIDGQKPKTTSRTARGSERFHSESHERAASCRERARRGSVARDLGQRQVADQRSVAAAKVAHQRAVLVPVALSKPRRASIREALARRAVEPQDLRVILPLHEHRAARRHDARRCCARAFEGQRPLRDAVARANRAQHARPARAIIEKHQGFVS